MQDVLVWKSVSTLGSSINYLGNGKSKYDFYLGGTDSCQGDSGNFFLKKRFKKT